MRAQPEVVGLGNQVEGSALALKALDQLIRMRRAACNDALRLLVDCLAAEGRAEWAASEAERAIAGEIEAASDPSGSDEVVEAFAAWLPGARRKLEAARSYLERLQAETARARAELTACRAALEGLESARYPRRPPLGSGLFPPGFQADHAP